MLVSATVLAVMALAFASYGENPDGSIHEHFQPEDTLYKSPIHMALTRDGGLLFVVCHNTNSVQMVDPQGRRVLGEITVGRRPYDITLSPDDRQAYVSNSWDDTISVIDVGAFKVIDTISAGADPHGVILDRSGENRIAQVGVAFDHAEVLPAADLLDYLDRDSFVGEDRRA